ncbi:SH3 domain-containing protein, partial [Siminovitchia sediminis]
MDLTEGSEELKKKIVIPSLCFAALSTVAFEEAVQAADPPAVKAQMDTRYVNVNKGSVLNLRSSASTSSAVVGKLPAGTKVTVHSESNGWAKVAANGQVGYVSSKYLSGKAATTGTQRTSAPAPTQTKTMTKYVNVNPGSALNVRSKSSTSGSVIGSLSSGTKVTVYSESKGWAQINYNGRTGYVSSTYLSGSAPSFQTS